MVRIAGIDREVSPLEILWAQADPQERLNLALTTVIQVSEVVEDGKMAIEMNDGTKYVVQVTKEAKQ